MGKKTDCIVAIFALAPTSVFNDCRLVEALQIADRRSTFGVRRLWRAGLLTTHVKHVVVATTNGGV